MSNLFSVGTSALLANQRALATTGHNIANANTEGYSRQQVEFAARTVSNNPVGQGVEITRTERVVDPFASSRLVESTSAHAAMQTGAELTRRLDATLSSASTGLAAPLRDFIGAVESWSADPAAEEARVEVLGQAETLSQRFSQLQGALEDLNVELNDRTKAGVEQINQIASSIARVNDEISLNQSGEPANDLLDMRERLVTQLSEQIDIRTSEQGDGSLNVFAANGQALVVGASVETLVAAPGLNPGEPVRVLNSAGGDLSGQIEGGELGGVMGFRFDVLDPAQQQLTNLAQSLINRVNTVQAAGTDLNGNAGQPLLVGGAVGARMSVALSDPAELAGAATGASAGSGDNTNALSLLDALRGPLVNNQTAQDVNTQLVGRVGSQARSLEASETAQAALMQRHQNLKDSVSGVNLDEEAANLMRYQQSYQAAAQIIATANAMFDALLAAAR